MRFLFVLLFLSCATVTEGAPGKISFRDGENVSSTWQRVFHESFGHGSASLDVSNGTIAVGDDLDFRNLDAGQNGFVQFRHAPFADEQIASSSVSVRERIAKEGWSLSGITIMSDPENFWMLALVEDGQGRRSVDFIENYNGIWQAQNQDGPTKLVLKERTGSGVWQPGREHNYRLRLTLDKNGITAAVTDVTQRPEVFRARYEFGTSQVVRSGAVALIQRGGMAAFDDVGVMVPRTAQNVVTGLKVQTGSRGNIALLKDALPGIDWKTTDAVALALRRAGFGVTPINAEQVSNPAVLDTKNFFLLAVPNAAVYPADGARALTHYLRRGGHLLLLGAPPFSRPVWRHNNEWLDQGVVKVRMAQQEADRVFIDFNTQSDLKPWNRASSDATVPASLAIDAGPEAGSQSLKIAMDNMTGWHTYASPVMENMFAPGQELLTFWAKGDARTPQLSVEVNERDGSRWIAVVPLKTEWTYHVLSPEDFLYWKDSHVTKPRGNAGDLFNPQEATRVIVGLSSSHTPSALGSPHTFWIARFGSAANPYRGVVKPGDAFPTIETVHPSYKLLPAREVASIALLREGPLTWLDQVKIPVTSAYGAISRPRNAGFGNGHKWHCKRLLSASNSRHATLPSPAWLTWNLAPPYVNSGVAVFGFQDQALLRTPPILEAINYAVDKMATGVFLSEGGARHFSHFAREKIEVGATVVNSGRKTAKVRLKMELWQDSPIRMPMPFETLCNEVLTLAPGESRTVRPTWAGFLSDRYGNRTSLSVVTRVYDVAGSQEKYLDSISHDLGLLDTNFHRDEFITVRGNDFVRYGKPWYPVGMNYWPSYVAGLEPGDYNAGWLKPAYYDPAIVERDLVRMKSLGINMVSIQTGGLESQRNLLDFLNRCRNHAIRVNAFIGGAQPTDFHEAEVAAYIKAGKLDQNPTIFAYDIIWEPGNWMFNAANRPKYDADWQKWIIERYGSIAIAEAAWGMPAPRTDGRITSPSDAQLREDGTHRIMVAAYRRFMDDFTSAKWNDATRRLRRLVPNQLISFRQGNTLPHDFALTGPVKYIDFICPEGYSIPPGEKGHDAAGFITRYVNFTTRGKPIIWSEFGQSVWDATQMQPDENAIQRVSDYHELFYKVVLEAGANGTAPWWWPGGYRVNERSDFGVMNADGTPRPIAELIKKYSPLIQTPRTYPAPDRWLTIDRDSHAGGYWRLAFNEGAEAYGAARKAKKHLGVRTVGTGTTSANVPPIRIGNAAYGPLKYLNAEFNWLQIKDIDGKWIEARDGVEIRIRHNAPVQVRASLGNTQEATWLAKQERTGGGLVFLAPQGDEGMAMTRNINTDVPYLGDADLGEFMLIHYMPTARKAIALQMYCDGRGWFGEKRNFVLVPVV